LRHIQVWIGFLQDLFTGVDFIICSLSSFYVSCDILFGKSSRNEINGVKVDVVLFINGNLGLKILKLVIEKSDVRLVSVFVNSSEKKSSGFTEEVKDLVMQVNHPIPIVTWENSESATKNLENLGPAAIGISALFGHVLTEDVIMKFSHGILNLHPSLLPIGRGAHPIPWSIIENLPQGISIHLISKELDAGEIIFQKTITSDIAMSAGEVYETAVSELAENFLTYWSKWLSGEILAYPQSDLGITYHRSSELLALSTILETEYATFGDFVRRIQATTFSNGDLPSFKDNTGKVWKISLTLSEPKI